MKHSKNAMGLLAARRMDVTLAGRNRRAVLLQRSDSKGKPFFPDLFVQDELDLPSPFSAPTESEFVPVSDEEARQFEQEFGLNCLQQ